MAIQQWTIKELAKVVDEEFDPHITTWRDRKSDILEYVLLVFLVLFVGLIVVVNIENRAEQSLALVAVLALLISTSSYIWGRVRDRPDGFERVNMCIQRNMNMMKSVPAVPKDRRYLLRALLKLKIHHQYERIEFAIGYLSKDEKKWIRWLFSSNTPPPIDDIA
ncbi:MAG: hypothetical protein ACTSUO_06255 [Candidatus Thorarchaeota archaeon]